MGRQNQVDTGGTGLLGQTRNQLLDLLAHHHHQVGQLVDHHHDVRQALERLRVIRRQAEGVVDELFAGRGFVDFLVVTGQVAHTHLAHQLVAFFHLGHTPIQAMRGLPHVGHHRGQQVRDAFINRHLEHLGVNHQEPHIAGLGLVQQRQDHGVDTHRFARTGGTGHQHMRHLGQIGHHRVADDVLAQAHGQHGLGLVVDLRAQNFAELDRLALGVGQLQRHVVFAGNRLDHPDGHQAERTRQISGQVHHLRTLDARVRLDLVAGDHRARGCSHHTHLDTKIRQLFLDQAAGHLQRLGRHGFLSDGQAVEQIHLRQLAVGQFVEQGFLALLDHAVAARHLHHGRLNDTRDRLRHRHRRQVQLAIGRIMDGWRQIPLGLNGLGREGLLAFAQSLLAQSQVFFDLALFMPRLDQGVEATPDFFSQLTPGKTEHHGHAH